MLGMQGNFWGLMLGLLIWIVVMAVLTAGVQALGKLWNPDPSEFASFWLANGVLFGFFILADTIWG